MDEDNTSNLGAEQPELGSGSDVQPINPTPNHAPRQDTAVGQLRIWPSMIVCFGIVPLAVLVSVFVSAVAIAWAVVTQRVDGPMQAEQWLMQEFLATPFGLLCFLIPAQLTFLFAALIPARLSSEPTLQRLGLVRGQFSLWMLPLFMAGTIFVMFLSMYLVDALFEAPSPHLEQMAAMLRDTPLAVFIGLLLFISLAPGFAEEFVFRGYVQRRLMQRWSPLFAIALPSVLFAIAHLDVQHSIGVFMIGLWLGVLMWRTGSLWVCICCHAFNNAVAVAIARFATDPDSPFLNVTMGGIFLASLIAFAISVALLCLIRPGRGKKKAEAHSPS